MLTREIEDDISILATTYVPVGEEAIGIATRSRARRKEIRQIDHQISALQDRRNALIRACKISSALLTPIRKVPVEILVEIFLQCTPSLQESMWLQSTWGKTLKRIGGVCRTWRTILNNTPSVWSTIVLDERLGRHGNLARWLDKTKSHPLIVRIPENINPLYENNIRAAVATLSREFGRIQSLHVAPTIMFTILPDLLPFGSSRDALMLQSLSISQPTLNLDYGSYGVLHCPQLQSLKVSFPEHVIEYSSCRPLQSLCHLSVDFRAGATISCIELISACPNLVSLYWRDNRVSLEWMDNNTTEVIQNRFPRVVLQSLKTLRLMLCNSYSPIPFLTCLYVPSLEFVDILTQDVYLNDGYIVAYEMLDAIGGDDPLRLRYFHLDYNGFLSGPNVSAMLRHLDCLHTLVLSHTIISSDQRTATPHCSIPP